MTTMKAAVVPELGAKLEIQELTVPEPGPGQVLVKIEASGLCHTDIHAAYGDWPVKPNPPFIPGHEGVGVVTATGPGATLHKPGDRVAIAWLVSACGHCPHCVAGWETLCEAQQNSGYSVDGTFAEYAVADDRYVVDVPDLTVNARTTDPVQAIAEYGGADVAVVTAACPRTFEQAYASLRRGGRLSCVGLPADDKITISVFDTVLSGKQIIGSIVGTRKDLADVFALHAAGRTKVIAEPRQLEDVNACFDEVLAGHVPARLVFTF